MPRRPPRLRQRRLPLTIDMVLQWVDYEFAQTGRWPQCKDGPVLANPNEKWTNIDASLRLGHRGLPGGSSLPKLLAAARGVRNQGDLPEAEGENWAIVDTALRRGLRGLPGGTTLFRLLKDRACT